MNSLKVVLLNITCFSPMQLIFHNHIITANSVEKHFFVVLNVKLEVKIRFKKFYWLLELIYNIFAWKISTNKRVIYGLKMNLYIFLEKHVLDGICASPNFNFKFSSFIGYVQNIISYIILLYPLHIHECLHNPLNPHLANLTDFL